MFAIFSATSNTNITYRTHQNGEAPVIKIIEAFSI